MHADLLAKIEQLMARVASLTKSVERQQGEIDDLKAKLGRDSSNSSKPPSSDPPWIKRAPPKTPSGRKQGGQPGHPGSQRHLLDTSAVDALVPHFPPTCGECGHALPPVPDGDPLREQIWELPPIKPHVTEHQFHSVVCPQCKATTVATRGPEMPKGSFGPRAEATAAYFQGACRLSVRETRRVFADLLAFPISTGALSRIAMRTSTSLDLAYDAAVVAVRRGDPVHADETTWSLRGVVVWLWHAGTEWLRVFKIDPRRTIDARKAFLGDVLDGVLVADRFVAYEEQPRDRRQFCLAHLRRDAQAIIDRGGKGRPWGKAFLALLTTTFDEWRLFEDVHHDRAFMRERLRPTWDAIVDLLIEGADGEDDRVAEFCAHLIMRCEAIWTFTERECPPTNNLAEQGMRKPVLWRRNCLGSQSERGCRFVERMLTTVESLRAQGRDVLAFLVESMSAAAQGRAPPSLVQDR
jgi:transposase